MSDEWVIERCLLNRCAACEGRQLLLELGNAVEHLELPQLQLLGGFHSLHLISLMEAGQGNTRD